MFYDYKYYIKLYDFHLSKETFPNYRMFKSINISMEIPLCYWILYLFTVLVNISLEFSLGDLHNSSSTGCLKIDATH